MRVRIATRASRLALAQATMVADRLGGAELVKITTSGDEGEPRADQSDKARFVTEVEAALLDGRADLAVHSAKDLPAEMPPGLELVAVSERRQPLDAMVGPAGSLDEIPSGARVGTASVRRRSQLLRLRDDLEVVEIRGNLDTRLRKLDAGEVDYLVLAAAGLGRLGLSDRIGFLFDPEQMVPAAGQGALALQARRGDSAARAMARALNDSSAAIQFAAERAVLAGLGGDCDTPLGAFAQTVAGGVVEIYAYVGLPDGSKSCSVRLSADRREDSIDLAQIAVVDLVESGAVELIAAARESA